MNQSELAATLRENPEGKMSDVDTLARDLAIHLLAQWIAIDHGQTRLQGDGYMLAAEELADYLEVIGYRLVGKEDR